MHEYSRQHMLRLVNKDKALAEIYMNRIAENGREVDEALTHVFLGIVASDKKYRDKYEDLFDPIKDDLTWADMKMQLGPDSPVVAEIRRLVNQFGWRGFIRGLAQYAYKKALEKKALGLTDDVAAWASVQDKVSKLRKGVKL